MGPQETLWVRRVRQGHMLHHAAPSQSPLVEARNCQTLADLAAAEADGSQARV